ncbi:MAG: hypothetical protein QOD73_599, partial [Solirubrobacteraceae bacterium]|nr:hypothetical protein [Solirubrobacteraceae bacterium]
ARAFGDGGLTVVAVDESGRWLHSARDVAVELPLPANSYSASLHR